MPIDLGGGLRQHRRRLTKPRSAVLAVLAAAEKHLTPQEVYRRAHARRYELGLTTVYRTLDLLVELGYAQRIHLDSGCHSYAAAGGAHAHQLVCSGCGRAEGFADCDLEPLVALVQARTGYAIDVHMLELMGRCPQCQAKSQSMRRTTPRGAR